MIFDEQTLSARKLVDIVLTDSRPAEKVWDELLTKKSVGSRVLSESITILHDRKQYDVAVEAIQSAIRNDQAVAWMYDVLAFEMKLAKRPAREIARVLESRIDFANADVPQLLIAVALMSRFEAWDEAVQICREATELNPDLAEPWLLARSVADKSSNVEHRVWARCGILRHVWTDDSPVLHEEARSVITEIARQLDIAGNSPQAEGIRTELREASTVDLMLILRWVGSADLDLLVTQPNGEQCNFQRRFTTNGGQFTHDDAGSATEGNAKRYEQYICRVAQAGNYKAAVRFVLGKAVAGTAVLETVQNYGTPEESRSTQTIKLNREDVEVVVPFKGNP
jgi:tetratricopeptide (TPR) repeat protein